jgi:hypothetical protein
MQCTIEYEHSTECVSIDRFSLLEHRKGNDIVAHISEMLILKSATIPGGMMYTLKKMFTPIPEEK